MLGDRSDPNGLLFSLFLQLLVFLLSVLFGLDPLRSALEESFGVVVPSVTSGDLKSGSLVRVLKDFATRNFVDDLA